MGGWIKLYDKMLNWEWYGNTNVVRVFLHCLLKANYQPKVWQGIRIERGQFITSIATMADELGLTSKQVRGALGKLKMSNNVAIKGANKYSVITICNYDSYQTADDVKGQTRGQATRQSNGQTKVTEKGNNNRYTDNTNNTDKQNDIKSTTDVVPKKEDTGEFDYKGYLLSKGVELQYINDWLKYRKSIKKAVTKSVIVKLEREAERAGISLAYAVQLAAENSWQSFQASYLKDKPRTASLFNNDSEERARFEAQLEIERKKDVERRKAEQEREIEEYRQREIQRINNIIYGNNDNNDNNK